MGDKQLIHKDHGKKKGREGGMMEKWTGGRDGGDKGKEVGMRARNAEKINRDRRRGRHLVASHCIVTPAPSASYDL